MDRIVVVADQILEAKRLLRSSEFSHLRIALLLLDNAAETLIGRTIRDMRVVPLTERQIRRARARMSDEEFRSWKALFGHQMPWECGEKVDFIVQKGMIEHPVGRVLKAIHRYRNEAYHRDTIRPQTIRSAVTVLFDLVTDLLVQLPTHRYSPAKAEWVR